MDNVDFLKLNGWMRRVGDVLGLGNLWDLELVNYKFATIAWAMGIFLLISVGPLEPTLFLELII